eukprot:1343332-Lingulodinium_polyedra.AAC.1
MQNARSLPGRAARASEYAPRALPFAVWRARANFWPFKSRNAPTRSGCTFELAANALRLPTRRCR